MSTDIKQAAETVEAQVQDAYTQMVDQVHVPHFFDKLAAHGIRPSSDEEAQMLLEMGLQLFAADTQQRTAAAGDNLIKRAYAALLPGVASDDESALIHDAATKYAQDAQLKSAALTLSTVLAAAAG